MALNGDSTGMTEPLLNKEQEMSFNPPPYCEIEEKETAPYPSSSEIISAVSQSPGLQYPPESSFQNMQQFPISQYPNQQPVIVMAQPPPTQQCNVNVGAGLGPGLGCLPVGTKPVKTVCPVCQAHISTKTNSTIKCKTHLCCILLCLSGVCCPLVFLPYCCCDPEKVEHTCPKCNAMIGQYYG